MANILIQSAKDAQDTEALLKKQLPSYRKAYSDRTAWVMACLSELAYVRFNPSVLTDKKKDFLEKRILKSLKGKKKTGMMVLINMLDYDHEAEYKTLEKEVNILEMKIVATFDSDGSQAILFSYGAHLVLAFRGTEATSIKDIKADAKAKIVPCESGGKIHTGFNDAFNAIGYDIQQKLKQAELKDKPLFITGHSLGGALASIAAKKLSHEGGIAACYTFGAPRVGNEAWIETIKTPIYRLVNAADCVPMLPPSDEIITIFAWFFRALSKIPIPVLSPCLKSFSRWLKVFFGGYMHCGNMRFLTNCPKGDYAKVNLLHSVSFWRKVKGYGIKKLGKSFLADHSISVYRKKLMVIAIRRNP